MDLLNISFFIAGTLVFISVLAGLYSARAGLSFLVVFLVVGMLAGEDGPGGIAFDDLWLSMWVGSAALAIILLDGGLRTQFSTFRTGLKPAAWLATVGVVVTAGITAGAAMLFLGLDPGSALLVGAIVGSTDAAAVFALMKSAGLRISERLIATLEIESGLNDPMAIFMVLALTAWATLPGEMSAGGLLTMFLQQALLGLAVGVACGFAGAKLLRQLPLTAEQEGLTALLLLSSGLAVFAGTGWAGGSGFLAVYLYGLLLAHRAPAVVARALSAMDGFAWLAQALLFLLLGLLVTPSRMLEGLLPALGVAAVLMFVARPVAVWLCLKPLRFTRSEIGFISWVGLRGAVPVVLAVFPLIAGVPYAREFFDVAFVVVLASLVLQGSTLLRVATFFGLNLPDVEDEPARRAVFGDFSLDPQAPVAALFQFYGLQMPEGDGTLAAWLERQLQRPPVVGDAVPWSGARFSVREMDGPRIIAVGLAISDTGGDPSDEP
jgi:cell volume regulation protein A